MGSISFVVLSGLAAVVASDGAPTALEARQERAGLHAAAPVLDAPQASPSTVAVPSRSAAVATAAARVPVVGNQAAVVPAGLPAAAAECTEVAAPRPVGYELLPSLTPLGRIEATDADGFEDDYLYSPNGEFKIGTRRDWGSTIVFFGAGGEAPGFNDSNVIDANDTGREVQVALYDLSRLRQGCAWDASCLFNEELTGCGDEITFLGWNPVQGGNECNQGGSTEGVLHAPGLLESVVRPNFWNPDWQAPDCRNVPCSIDRPDKVPSDVRYRQRLRFVLDHVVEMWMEYTNLSVIDHPPMPQEFPTVYSSFGKVGPDLRVILDSEGNRVDVSVPANDGFFTRVFLSPGGFAALQNDRQDYGIGLYHENQQRFFQAWQLLGQFNNVRARFEFGLPARGTVRGRAYLILGGFETVRQTAELLDARLPPFGELESPRADAEVGDRLRVVGWVLDNREVDSVEVLLDGRPVATAVPDRARPDVCVLWPGYPMCDRVGFELALDLAAVSRCPHLLSVVATDSDGNRREIDRRRIFVGEAPECEGAGCERRLASHPVYRYSWGRPGDADHSFSRSPEPPQEYEAEGVGFRLFSESGDGLVTLWQTYCAECTDHMQSTDAAEGLGSYAGAVALGYCSLERSDAAPRELRRLWSPELTDHYVSVEPDEWQQAVANGYQVEGGCWVP